MTDYDSVSFRELQQLCKSKGLPADGNREQLIAKLTGVPYISLEDRIIKIEEFLKKEFNLGG